jgi:N-acetylmuramoyl-L-alanine amidase
MAVPSQPAVTAPAPASTITQPAPPPPVAPPAPSWSKVSVLAEAPAWEMLAAYNKTMTREEFEKAMKDLYSDGSPLPPPWKLIPEGVEIVTGKKEFPKVIVTFRQGLDPQETARKFWRGAGELPPLAGRPPLSDLHVAIDPGHIGGEFARMEERFLSFAPNESIQEGDLSLMVARQLKPRLEALGAHVMLVREKNEPVTTARPDDFRNTALEVLREAGIPAPKHTYAGITGDEKIITLQWQSEKLFYRVSEIMARARRVNGQIRPDVVLCLHFNAESWGDATAPQFSPMNHLHIMVNGNYATTELEMQDVRYAMFDRLFNRTHEEELPLATALAKSMAAATGLPPYVYTTTNARRAGDSPYVYARNLLANRIYQCPVIYFEPYVMNHEETYRRLLSGHYIGRTLVGGKLQTSPIEDYVRGIVHGLTEYYQSRRAP